MDLLTYLQNYDPQKLVCLSSNTYRAHEHDSHNDSRWRWLSRGIEGRSMQDYFIKVKEIHFTEAVGIIVGQAAVQPPVFAPTPKAKMSDDLLSAGIQTHGVRP